MRKKDTFGFIPLGCPKNTVDGEIMIKKLIDGGFEYVDYLEENADVVIVNTCGFIDDAKKEAIENNLDLAEMKK